MFLSWTGYEIDGSDTNFNMILPEAEQLMAFIDCFVQLPILISDKTTFFVREWERQPVPNPKPVDYAALRHAVLTGAYTDITISVHFKNVELLDDATKSTFTQLGAKRNPVEARYDSTKTPVTQPLASAGTTELCITKKGVSYMPDLFAKDAEKNKGFETNIALFLEELPDPVVMDLWVPVGSTYEYFIYIMETLTAHFPNLATAGGLDCEGGWTHGCTYADSLYAYEKIQLPMKHGLSHFVKKMVSNGMTSYTYGSFRSSFKRTFEFYLSNQEKTLPFKEYLEQMDLCLQSDLPYFESIVETATRVLIPSLADLEKDETVCEDLKPLTTSLTAYDHAAFVSFYKKDDELYAEYRIRPQIKEYFLTYLKFSQFAMLPGTEEKMYHDRYEFEKDLKQKLIKTFKKLTGKNGQGSKK